MATGTYSWFNITPDCTPTIIVSKYRHLQIDRCGFHILPPSPERYSLSKLLADLIKYWKISAYETFAMNCTAEVRGSGCDGNGYVCLPYGICVCDSGWTGLSPFLGGHSNSCDVHEDTMFSFAIIESSLASIYILMILRHIAKRLVMTKSFQLFIYDPKTLCSCIFFMIGASDIALSVCYLARDRKRSIIDEMPTAVATAFHAFFCFSGLSIYFQILLHYLKSSLKLMTTNSRSKVLSHLTILRNFSWLVTPFSIPISLSSILSVVYPRNKEKFAMSFIVGIGILVYFYVILFLIALGYIVAELTSHLKTFEDLETSSGSDALKLVCSRLKLAYRVGGISLLGGSALMVLFGSWNFLFTKFVYLAFMVRLNSLFLFTVLYITISGVPSSNPVHGLTKKGVCYSRIIQVLGIQNTVGTTVHTNMDDNSSRMRGTSVKMSNHTISKGSRNTSYNNSKMLGG